MFSPLGEPYCVSGGGPCSDPALCNTLTSNLDGVLGNIPMERSPVGQRLLLSKVALAHSLSCPKLARNCQYGELFIPGSVECYKILDVLGSFSAHGGD